MKLQGAWRWALAATLIGTAAVALMPEADVASATAPLEGRPDAPAAPRTLATSASPATDRQAGPTWPDAIQRQPGPSAPSIPTRVLAGWDGPTGAAASPAASAPVAAAAPAETDPQPPAPNVTLIGLVEDAGVLRALLLVGPLGGQKTLVVATGDAVDANWSVESIADRSLTLIGSGGVRHNLRFKPA